MGWERRHYLQMNLEKPFQEKLLRIFVPHKTTKEQSGTLPYPDFLEFHSLLPLPNYKLILMRTGTSIIWYPKAERGLLRKFSQQLKTINKNLLSAYCVPGTTLGTCQ